MPGPVEHRSVTPFLKLIREIGRGKKIVQGLRFTDEQSARTQPPPDVPGGPYHKTSQIYYYTHDARREVQPPLIITTSKQIGIKSKSHDEDKCTPGKTYNWD